ncbi:DNA polymerase zeta catalytic subunit isoform X1 [Agrilus planipennis]|uniref:DNA polymerase zeta catalytic subunit n=1 Tax=Agrilus planipennis TaxID=224129 RepID=A0A7F5R1Z3_AGRPL|nr:DNA polymerase zeta catalytic subunit isoform X1 [Agrilus planipennis]
MAIVRIVNADFYMSPPISNLDVTYSEFRGSSVKQVPVIRIFGSTNTGDKTCLHIHGAFPYIYVPYDDSDKEDVIMYQMASGLDKAINISFGQASSNAQHIYKIVLVSGRPMYGYHAREHQFLKIFFYNPLLVKRASMLLQNGSVMSKIFQPHEAHLPFVLQFMIDYNLHGMSFVYVSKVFYRQGSICQINDVDSESFLPSSVLKISTCQLEIDTLSIYIENRLEIVNGNLASNPGIMSLWNDEKQRRRNKQQSSQMSNCLTQNRKNVKQTESHFNYLKILVQKIKSFSADIDSNSSSESNNSVYPAEKPKNKDLLNASTTLCHISASLTLSCTNTVQNKLEETCNDAENPNDSIFLDPDAQKFLQVLKNLNKDEESDEEDSVLSQKIQSIEEDVEFDLSLSLQNVLDDFQLSSWEIDRKDDGNENIESIPQLDGAGEVSNNKKKKINQSIKTVRKVKRKLAKKQIENKNSQTLQEETLKHFLSKPVKLHVEGSTENVESSVNFPSDLTLQNSNENEEKDILYTHTLENNENDHTDLSNKLNFLLNIYKPSKKSIRSPKKSQINYIGMYANNNSLLHCDCKNEIVKAPMKKRKYTKQIKKIVSKLTTNEEDTSKSTITNDQTYPNTIWSNYNESFPETENIMTVKVCVPPEYGNSALLKVPIVDKSPSQNPTTLDMPDLNDILELDNNDNSTSKNINNEYIDLIKEIDAILEGTSKISSKENNSNGEENLNHKGVDKIRDTVFETDNNLKSIENPVDMYDDFGNVYRYPFPLDSNENIEYHNGFSNLLTDNSVNSNKNEISEKASSETNLNESTSLPEFIFKDSPVSVEAEVNTETSITNVLDTNKTSTKEAVSHPEEGISAETKSAKERNHKSKKVPLSVLFSNYQYIISRLDLPETQQFLDYLQSRIEKRFYKSISQIKNSPHGKYIKLPNFKRCKHGVYNVKKKVKKNLERRCTTKKNCNSNELVIKSLDGAWDSSSDEESTKKKNPKCKRHPRTPKYSPLTVVINSPLKSIHKISKTPEDDSEQVISSKTNCATTKNKKLSQNLEQTYSEEHLECRYSLCNKKGRIPNVLESSNKENSNQKITSSKLGSTKLSHNSSSHIKKEIRNKTVPDKSGKNTIAVGTNNRIFCDNVNDNIKHKDLEDNSANEIVESIELVENIVSDNVLNNSTLYDKQNNYEPVAGTSDNLNNSFDYFSNTILSQTRVFLEEEELFSTSNTLTHSEVDENKAPFSQSSSTSSSSITPYQKPLQDSSFSKFSQQLSLLEFDNTRNQQNNLTQDDCKVIMPKFNPPTNQMVLSSMQEFNIPLMRHQEPYYSNIFDVTGTVEVGHNSLKILSNKSSDFPIFEHASMERGLEFFRKNASSSLVKGITVKDFSKIKLSLCTYEDCLVTPAKLPPTRKEVENWLKNQKDKVNNITPKKKKKKVLVPCSPDNENDSQDESLTLTPNTPLELRMEDLNQASNAFEIENEMTPKNMENKKRSLSLSLDQKSKKRIEKSKLIDKFKDKTEHIQETTNEKSLESTKEFQSSDDFRKTLLRNQSLNFADSRQISNATLNNTFGFKMSLENLQKARAVAEHQFITLLAMELHTKTRGDFKPNPEYDPIRAIFYTIFNDVPDQNKRITTGIIAVKVENNLRNRIELLEQNVTIKHVDTEQDLINDFADLVRTTDPDIVAGYEIEMQSWGYLFERSYKLNINLRPLLSRSSLELKHSDDEQQTELNLTGRIVLDVWRLLRHEIALQSYSFENVLYHVMHRRVPKFCYKDLTFWWEHKSSLFYKRTIDHYLYRVRGMLDILEQLDIVGRTSELARLFGIQFYEVLSRGSQFRVESMMLRLAKPLNYIAVSPSVQQRAKMNAPEYLPLILEPQSRYYADPVIVLDFQSLYPSMIIAYNYCFSTCLGKVERLGKNIPFEFGATQLKLSRNRLKKLVKNDALNISPCGAAFVKECVREGILPRMLREILDTRLMVKKSIKENAGDKTLQRVLHNRQLGLKLIANVTYGYTAANFSGRMPSVEVGDSVVSKGRETLLRAIKLIQSVPEWGAKVIYGDTDSIFVLTPGRSKKDAFRIGTEIADAVTNDNPSPVKLKLEKVFQPCILQTKKRYVGYMYESPDQKEPELCSKGIETIRRDGCPAVSKILEKCLKILFDTQDVSLVRQYVVRQFVKLFSGRVSLQDLTFAKEYRGEGGYRPGACVPALELAKKWKTIDKRNEPRRKERVPYVIINGPPGLPLIKLVRCPRELLADSNLRINALYYITHAIIPPLNRCLNLIGADVNIWFKEMPRKQVLYLPTFFKQVPKKSTISQYFFTTTCVSCGAHAQNGLCDKCLSYPTETMVVLQEKLRNWEKNYQETLLICQSCCKRYDGNECISLDCPILYRLNQTHKDLQQAPFVRQLVSKSFDNDSCDF